MRLGLRSLCGSSKFFAFPHMILALAWSGMRVGVLFEYAKATVALRCGAVGLSLGPVIQVR